MATAARDGGGQGPHARTVTSGYPPRRPAAAATRSDQTATHRDDHGRRENGEPLHPATITDRFHELVAAADPPPVRLHDLRHGAASIMLAAGVDLKVMQETLGHSSITLTSDTYTSVYPAVAAAAADAAAVLVPRSALH